MDLGNLLGGIDTDAIADVVKVVVDNRAMIEQLGRLPELFGQFADSLDGAGHEAGVAALALVGADGESGARGALASAATALAGIVTTLDSGIARIADTAEGAAKVPLMGGPAAHLAEAARDMGESTAQLGTLAASMGAIAAVLDEVASALRNVGGHLTDTGAQARGFVSTT